MAITFVEKKKRQRILILALLAIFFLIAGVIWWGFFAGIVPFTKSVIPAAQRIQVDMTILFHPVFQDLDEVKETTQILPEVGRDNPFLPLQ